MTRTIQKQAEPGTAPRPRGPAPAPKPHAPRPPWAPAQRDEPARSPRGNRTGLPDALKAGVEALSGLAMDDVRVHRNSSLPAAIGAFAYTKGSDIHVAPGQERHLPHEAWHVAQQKQGRVRPTMQLKAGAPVNDDPTLEREADDMGARAAQMRSDGAEGPRQLRIAAGPNGSVHQLVAVDLYRSGNANSPRMDNVRDHDVTIDNGVVKANTGGISTNSNQGALQGKVWRFPKDTNPPDNIGIVNDHGTHYAWQSTEDVTKDVFKQRLALSHASFVKTF